MDFLDLRKLESAHLSMDSNNVTSEIHRESSLRKSFISSDDIARKSSLLNTSHAFFTIKCIDQDIYVGEPVNLTYPSVDDFVNLIKLKGRNCGIFKRDLKRAYRQIPIDPGDINFVGFHWKNHIFVDRVLSMGLRSSAHICQRVTSSVVYMMKQSGYLLLNYLDDFAGAEKSEDANVVFDLLGRLLDSCGLEESVEKTSSPNTVMTL
ncbi:unnamed protein product [Mytilus edulis]|uniref:Reverse transcriptase domain-containing protein n=1 Tax=Mytilus edulis TaxID=6550 RepID=A0A8S3VR38_MYTED|nr:unnamed protein product [Mytilus edulis]